MYAAGEKNQSEQPESVKIRDVKSQRARAGARAREIRDVISLGPRGTGAAGR